MSAEDLVRQYLDQKNIMQLATTDGDQLWVCSLHYHADEAFYLYWASKRDRLHSRHIDKTGKAAATIMIHEDTPEEKHVIGISLTGTAELINDIVSKKIVEAYVQKLDRDPNLSKEGFYRLKPTSIVLFDSKNFPEDPRQIVF